MRATALELAPVGEELVPVEECIRRVSEDLSTIATLMSKLRQFVPLLSYVEDFFVIAAIRLESRAESRRKLERNLEPLLQEIKVPSVTCLFWYSCDNDCLIRLLIGRGLFFSLSGWLRHASFWWSVPSSGNFRS